MEQEPLQHGNQIMSVVKTPHGGMLLMVLLPLLLLSGAGLLVWLVDRLPHTAYADDMDLVVGLFGLLEVLLASLMLFITLPPYLRFAKNARGAMKAASSGGRRYVSALLGSGLGFWEYDLINQDVYFSARMMSMLGFPDRESLQPIKFWYDLIHPEDLEGVQRSMQYQIDRRTPEYSVEYRMRRNNGEYVWVADKGKVVLDEDLKATHLSGVTEDISNIRRVQEVLESRTAELQDAKSKIEEEIQNVRKFQKVVDSSTEAVSITSPDGALVYVNAAWSILNGYSESEALGRNSRLLKSGENPSDVFVAMWEKIASGAIYHTEDIINKRKDGSKYQADLSIFPIREGTQTLFYVSLCQDISLRKEVDRAKTEFVSLASHQLRTPLSAIRWYSEMLLSKYVGELNDKQRQYLKEIYAGNLRMVELVNALLNVSRLELGTFAIEPEDVNLVEVCESVLSELSPQITEKTQTIERIFADAPPTYPADPKLIRIVFQNFLSNSVKYTQPGGHIAVEIARREDNLYIRVTDDGYGIPKAQHSKIFEKLFRADNVRQKDTEGTGLGMYIVKAIIENSGGKIWFDSEENHGTTFHVLMPITGMPHKLGAKGLN